jgi:hypothetical protein
VQAKRDPIPGDSPNPILGDSLKVSEDGLPS